MKRFTKIINGERYEIIDSCEFGVLYQDDNPFLSKDHRLAVDSKGNLRIVFKSIRFYDRLDDYYISNYDPSKF